VRYPDEQDDSELEPWRGDTHSVEREHPDYCGCDFCRNWWLTNPEAYLIQRDGLPPDEDAT